MGKDIIKDSLICLANAKLNDTTYEIARDIVLDYINELQEENRTLKELNVCVGCNNNPDYKSRNDKAIDYITTEQLYTNYSWGKSQYAKILKDLLNILKGEE